MTIHQSDPIMENKKSIRFIRCGLSCFRQFKRFLLPWLEVKERAFSTFATQVQIAGDVRFTYLSNNNKNLIELIIVCASDASIHSRTVRLLIAPGSMEKEVVCCAVLIQTFRSSTTSQLSSSSSRNQHQPIR